MIFVSAAVLLGLIWGFNLVGLGFGPGLDNKIVSRKNSHKVTLDGNSHCIFVFFNIQHIINDIIKSKCGSEQ